MTEPTAPLYEAYRAHMRARYGPGPWRPEQVAEEDRWRQWVAREPREGAA